MKCVHICVYIRMYGLCVCVWMDEVRNGDVKHYERRKTHSQQGKSKRTCIYKIQMIALKCIEYLFVCSFICFHSSLFCASQTTIWTKETSLELYSVMLLIPSLFDAFLTLRSPLYRARMQIKCDQCWLTSEFNLKFRSLQRPQTIWFEQITFWANEKKTDSKNKFKWCSWNPNFQAGFSLSVSHFDMRFS